MNRLLRSFAILIFIALTGCATAADTQGPALVSTGEVQSLLETGPAKTQENRETTLISSILSNSAAAPAPAVTVATEVQPTPVSTRLPFENFSILEKASDFGAPYDEEYSFQVDSSIWQPVNAYEEGEWNIHEITTARAPRCTIQLKRLREDPRDVASIKTIDNRYRRMGAFTNSGLSFDIFSYTSNSESLADTQNVVYILTTANGDRPYMVKPHFRAISSYEDWENCRPLVRAALSTLVMKRVPPEP